MNKKGIWFVIGAAAAISWSFSTVSWTTFLIAASFFTFAALKKDRKTFFCLLGLSAVFFIRTEWVELTNISSLSGEEREIKGVLHEGPIRDGDKLRFDLKKENGEKIMVSVKLHDFNEIIPASRLSPGISCSVTGSLSLPSAASNFHAFDYRHYLKQHYTHWEMDVFSVNDLQCRKNSFSLYYMLKEWRHAGIQWIDHSFPEELKGVAAALLFGERALLDPDTENHYQSLGLIHLLAVSGLHAGLLSGMIYYMLLRIGLTREKAEWVLLLLLPAYIVLAGAAPSVIRAVSVTMIFIIWRKTGRKTVDPFFVLCLFAVLLLFLQPYYLLHIGFQLSFLISASLLLSRNMLKTNAYWKAAFYVSSIAQLAGLPVVLFHFYEFSLLSILLNLLFIPFVSILVLPGVILLFFLSFLPPFLFSFPAAVLSQITAQAHNLLQIAAGWKIFTLAFGKPSWQITVMLSLTIYYGLYRWDKYGCHVKLLLPLLLTMTVIYAQLQYPYWDNKGYVTVLDVGQGESIVMELPHRKAVYLIDGGGVLPFPKEEWEKRRDPYDPGEKMVMPFLKARGIKALDKVIVTHGDIDHYGGLFAVLEQTNVQAVLYGKGSIFTEEEKRFLQFVDHQNIPIVWSGKGNRWQEGQSKFQVLLPAGGEDPGNDRSIVFKAVLGGTGWLFTGDLEEAGEKKLLDLYPDVKADFLKVGHHGSRTSSTSAFIQQLQPTAAFLSAGVCNRFGHPHQETLQTLEKAGTQVFRTDAGGAVQIVFTEQAVQDIYQAGERTEPNCGSH
ncbi:DNA internalization-related competence protein ComEC/Rec2 [Salibacterium aidingense]|uniref:DNA internalization-related competence protein ComEC/Rec2 n=1 Tax=Salibacterium aidingense TaxID=384933 RepID=UPI000418CC97|nr:DNA internalization-related competence protein ComEC/Rec2 [Salibacterium aidingense]